MLILLQVSFPEKPKEIEEAITYQGRIGGNQSSPSMMHLLAILMRYCVYYLTTLLLHSFYAGAVISDGRITEALQMAGLVCPCVPFQIHYGSVPIPVHHFPYR